MATKKKRRKWLWIIIILLVIAIPVVYFQITSSKNKGDEVIVSVVKKVDISSTVSASGKINPVTQVKISSNLSAKIVKLGVKEGDIVKEGQFLVQFDSKPFQTAVSRAKASLNAAQSRYTKSLMDQSRLNKLYERGLTSAQSVDEANASMNDAAASVVTAQANLKDAIKNLADASIDSPMDGVITALNKEVGEVSKGIYAEDIIMIIGKLQKMEVVLEINENDVVNVKVGQTAFIKVDAIPDTIFKGKVSYIGQTGAPQGTTSSITSTSSTSNITEVSYYQVKVEVIDSIPGLRPGMSTGVDIVTDTRASIIAVPIQSVVMRSTERSEGAGKKEATSKNNDDIAQKNEKERLAKQQNYITMIFKYKGGKAVSSKITSGISSDTMIEIKKGLAVGDTVITGPFKVLRTLKDNDKVILYSSRGTKKGNSK